MTDRQHASATVGRPVDDLDTPALVIDVDAMQRNLEDMAAVAREAGVRLRPHTKTHKCPAIARLQLSVGASAITVAKVGEAEVMVAAGMGDVLIAYPILGDEKLRRVRALMERARVRVSLDSIEVADGLGRLGLDRGEPVEVLVEVDTGHHRLGRPPGGPTAELATGIDRVAGIEVLGLLSHAGHAYRASSPGELKRIVEREGADLGETAERCRAAGVEIREISVGTTPTARIEAGIGGITELRPGTYVFNDAQQMRLGTATEATSAARVLTTVVARPWEDRFVIDAGSKSLSSDGSDDDETPFPGRGVIAGRPDLRLDFLTEEHGVGTQRRTEAAGAPLAIGDRLEVIPLHVCSCVNMFDVAFGIRNGSVVEEFAIAGRGRVS